MKYSLYRDSDGKCVMARTSKEYIGKMLKKSLFYNRKLPFKLGILKRSGANIIEIVLSVCSDDYLLSFMEKIKVVEKLGECEICAQFQDS